MNPPRCRPFSGWTLGFVGLLLAGCETAASDPPPQSRSLAAVQVTGAFPVHIASDGAVTRVCGAPLDGSAPLAVNGVQFAVNLVADDAVRSKCAQDGDWSVHEGERIEGQVVTACGKRPTVDAAKWSLDLTCVGPRSATAETCQGLSREVAAASEVRYVGTAPRCDPGLPSTAHNVAVVMDHSGSISGQVTVITTADGKVGVEDSPDKATLETDFKNFTSDPFDSRIRSARDFIDSLSSSDRVISYFFDESRVEVACSNARTCEGGTRDGLACATDTACGKDSDGFPYHCVDRWQLNEFNDYQTLNPAQQAAKCFGATAESKADNKTGLELNARPGAQGRAPVWAAIDRAYHFLTVGGGKDLPGPKHLILFADGPDTCTYDEDFRWQSPSGGRWCRSKCDEFSTKYTRLVRQMQADGFPVQLHIIQFQSSGYRQPVARLQELACRSGGTYQFLATADFASVSNPAYAQMIKEATQRVRQAIAGQWHVTFSLPELQNDASSSPLPIGTMAALQGKLQLNNAALSSQADVRGYVFERSATLDQRLVLRKACRDTTDCGGSTCSANRCTSEGLCKAQPAADFLPCEGSGMCCRGKCQDFCRSSCRQP